MKRALAILGIASVFALAGCGDGTAPTDPVPPPVEETPLPGEEGDMDDDMDEDLNP